MLQENEKILIEYRADFLEKIRNAQKAETGNDSDRIEFDKARDGSSVLVLERDGQRHRLNSAFRPMQEAERWAAQYKLDYMENIILLFGLGNGIFARSLMKRMGERDSLIIYEPSSQIFHMILEQEDISDLLSNPRICILTEGINEQDFYFILEGCLEWRNVNALCICDHPGYKELFLDSFGRFVKQITDNVDLVHAQKHTMAYFAHESIFNMFFNLQYLSKANILGDFIGKIPEGLPAIIVAAGPSLDKNIEELKRAQGKAFILAVDSAVNILLDRGIPFDAMISVDATKNPSYMERRECRDIPLFCMLLSKALNLLNHRGKKIFVMGGFCIDDYYQKAGHPFPPIDLGGSVATAAFAVCVKLGFQKIVLIGQDLAYSGEVTHAGGKIKKIVNEDVGREEIEGWYGDKVKSRYDWIFYRNWFESAIQQLSGIQVIDATEGGALIHGSEVMALSEVIDAYCTQTFSMKELLNQMPPTFQAEEFQDIREKLRHMEKEMKSIKRNSEEAAMICSQAINLVKQCGQEVSLNKQVKRLDALNYQMISQPVYGFLDYYITDTAVEDLQDINKVTGSKEQDTLDAYTSAKALYDSMIQAVKDLSGKQLEESVNIVKQYLQEQVSICEKAIELINQNQYDEAVKKETIEQLNEIGTKILAQKIFWMFRAGVDEIVSKIPKSGNEELDLVNKWILDSSLCIEEADKFIQSGFIHRCLQRI